MASRRLASQHIARRSFTRVHELVGFMGAVQAQDYPMARWAIGTRLSHVTDKGVERALAKGEIVRAHLLRPTWHIVAARDVRWLLALTAPNIRSSMGKRHRDLELAAPVISRCNRALEKALASAGAMTREEIARLLERNGIATSEDNRLAHILMLAELDGVVCSGPPRANKPTYALLDERVPAKKTVQREDGLAELARRYFTSRGPASLRDFQWWSGLRVGDARLALALARGSLDSETANSETHWFSSSVCGDWGRDRDVHLLPAYDELLISYRDRSASLGSPHHARTISSNVGFQKVGTLGFSKPFPPGACSADRRCRVPYTSGRCLAGGALVSPAAGREGEARWKCGKLARLRARFPRAGGNRFVISTGPAFPRPDRAVTAPPPRGRARDAVSAVADTIPLR
jgi:hypothetical protein